MGGQRVQWTFHRPTSTSSTPQTTSDTTTGEEGEIQLGMYELIILISYHMFSVMVVG